MKKIALITALALVLTPAVQAKELSEVRVSILNKTGKTLLFEVKPKTGRKISGEISPSKKGLAAVKAWVEISSKNLGLDTLDTNNSGINVEMQFWAPYSKYALKVIAPADRKVYITVKKDKNKDNLFMKVYPQTGPLGGLRGIIESKHSKENQVRKGEITTSVVKR